MSKGAFIVRIGINYIAAFLAAGAAAVAIVAAPSALAAPNVPTCSDGGGSTQCQSTGNVQIYTAPHAMPPTNPTNSTYGPFLGYHAGRN
jgi:hypothetical protein